MRCGGLGRVGCCVALGVMVGVADAVGAWVAVGVAVGVMVGVADAVGVRVAVGAGLAV